MSPDSPWRPSFFLSTVVTGALAAFLGSVLFLLFTQNFAHFIPKLFDSTQTAPVVTPQAEEPQSSGSTAPDTPVTPQPLNDTDVDPDASDAPGPPSTETSVASSWVGQVNPERLDIDRTENLDYTFHGDPLKMGVAWLTLTNDTPDHREMCDVTVEVESPCETHREHFTQCSHPGYKFAIGSSGTFTVRVINATVNRTDSFPINVY